MTEILFKVALNTINLNNIYLSSPALPLSLSNAFPSTLYGIL